MSLIYTPKEPTVSCQKCEKCGGLYLGAVRFSDGKRCNPCAGLGAYPLSEAEQARREYRKGWQRDWQRRRREREQEQNSVAK